MTPLILKAKLTTQGDIMFDFCFYESLKNVASIIFIKQEAIGADTVW